MSKINGLIKKLCPNGIRYYQLSELEDDKKIVLGRGNVISKLEIQENPGKYPVYSSSALGNGEIGKYGKYMFEDVRISWSIDGGGRFFYRNDPKYSITNVSGWLKVVDNSFINTKYLYYALTKEWSNKVYDYTHKAHPSVVRKEYCIPIPPVEIQDEIVRILDKFDDLEADLEAELEARKSQYEFWLGKLLKDNDNMVSLKDISVSYSSGVTPLKSNNKFYENGTINWLRTGEVKFNEIYDTECFVTEYALEKTSLKIIPQNCIIVAISGATAGRCAVNKIPLTTNQHCLNIEIDSSKALYKYVFYCVASRYNELLSKKEGARGDLNLTKIINLKIPMRSLEEQGKIVNILDKFYTLINDISVGIPAEIESRRKQYEYYRNKLLSFEELRVNE